MGGTEVELELVEQVVAGGEGDDGCVVVHQSQGAVLEFAGGVALGVNIRELLEFEGALKRHRIHDVATRV